MMGVGITIEVKVTILLSNVVICGLIQVSFAWRCFEVSKCCWASERSGHTRRLFRFPQQGMSFIRPALLDACLWVEDDNEAIYWKTVDTQSVYF